MIDGFIEKTPQEKKYFDADFAADIPSGDTISSSGTTAAYATDTAGNNVSTTIIASTAVSTTKVRVLLQSGTDGMNYKIVVRAEMTSAGTRFDRIYELRVRASRKTS